MRDWLLRLKVRWKLLIAFGSVLVLSIVLMGIVINSTRLTLNYDLLNERIDRVNITTLEMNGLVKDFHAQGYKKEEFLIHGKSHFIDEFELAFARQDNLLRLVAEHDLFEESEHKTELEKLSKDHYRYRDNFHGLVDILKKRGFKDHGVEGELRKSIHAVEDAPYAYDKALMLMLRRHEKDFFLRRDERYPERFNSSIDIFRQAILTSDSADSPGALSILENINNYQQKFAVIVGLEKEIGLDHQSGAIGTINRNYRSMANGLADLTHMIKKEKQLFIQRSYVRISLLLAFQVIGGLILVLVYSNILTRAVREIKDAIVTLSNGAFPSALIIRTKDEMAQTKAALNQLVERIGTAADFAQSLGEGDLSVKYNERFKNDVLATSIINMQHKLMDMNRKQEVINWTNQGLAKFAEILKEDYDRLEVLSNAIITQLVSYINANQAAIYILDHETRQLTRTATYAYNKKKYVNDTVAVGQGLVGQCVLEAETIYISDVPADYMKITSGLGEATARNVLIVPLKSRDTIVGVLELTSFTQLEPYMITFVEKVSENIATILSNRLTAEKTEKLLAESRAKADTLASQEEELRQNTEELQATQEQLNRNEREYKKRIYQLEQDMLHKDKEILLLKSRISEVPA